MFISDQRKYPENDSEEKETNTTLYSRFSNDENHEFQSSGTP